ncbi:MULTISPECIES: hypothetical protein [unclassified Leifsonia]|uniref:hypothetical protein n=1 Tax=unclassified Leifsonia TaxID=2663824 RepID=UPI0007021F98|nr:MULTISPECIES: hypothetical protein [unclassified Leifsonia]KQX05396.1 hypothetical protein ASC59_14780 [Leifsonia sp. Root1293]KRA09029.1 hypothetical protein ASD61_14775 [Leifsonia sp. Root60]
MSTDSNPTTPYDLGVDGIGTTDLGATGHDATATDAAPAGPVIRWAAIVWGLAFAALATVLLVIVTDIGRRQDFSSWLETLTPGTFALYAVLALGALLLVAGLAGILRRATRSRA